eukprot:2015807-Amphidinium_carterae.1
MPEGGHEGMKQDLISVCDADMSQVETAESSNLKQTPELALRDDAQKLPGVPDIAAERLTEDSLNCLGQATAPATRLSTLSLSSWSLSNRETRVGEPSRLL